MTLETRITDLATTIAASINDAKTKRGDLATLTTTNKASLVAALNELKAAVDAAAGVAIDDSAASTTTVYSSTKVAAEIQAAVDALVNGAPGLLDTLAELATALTDNDSDITGILSAQALRVRVDAAQSFSAAQQTQARGNIGAQEAAAIGNPDTDFAAAFTAALN